ncbi:MAG: hypothetical protein OXF79_12965 [Chloroflexi bacterium]|nr:hypothetical protein [Chloroflexota bacterium]
MRSKMARLWDSLTPTQQVVVGVLLRLPLASDAELAAFIRLPTNTVSRALRNLRARGIVASALLGCLQSPVERWWWTSPTRSELFPRGTDWHQPGCRARLLERLSSVEHLYTAATQILDLGPFREWQWVDGFSMDAAIRCEDGWAALFWVGLLRSESRLAALIEDVGGDLESLAQGDPHPRPSLLCFVVLREWQVEMVRRVARRCGIEDWVRVWCAKDNTWHETTNRLNSRGWIRQPAYRRTMSETLWETRLTNSLWARAYLRDPVRLLSRVNKAIMATAHGDDASARLAAVHEDLLELYGDEATRKAMTPSEVILNNDGLRAAATIITSVARDIEQERPGDEAAAILRRTASFLETPARCKHLGHVLLLSVEFSGFTVAMGQVALGESRNDRRVQHTAALLRDFGQIVSWMDGKRNRYRVSSEASDALATMDRTEPVNVWTRLEIDRWNDLKKVAKHEHGVLDLVAEFMASGCPIAPGWPIGENFGDEGGIKPDAAVYLPSGPFGAGWYYIEYELSARSFKRIQRKLRGYHSKRRSDHWPLLVVCATERAEKHFQQAAFETGVDIATTTVARLRKLGAVGNTECWMLGGQPASLV